MPYVGNSEWKVVDLGCGGGNIAAFLKNKFKNWQITGIDISRDVINLATSKFPQIKFERASAEKIPGEWGSRDLIYAFDTLEHFENLREVLSSIRNHLRPNGVFYAAIPLEKQFPSLYWLLFKLGWRGKQKYSGHVNFFNDKEFIQLVESFGFRTVKMHYSSHFVFSVFDIAYYLMQGLLGKQVVSMESSITQMDGGVKKKVLKTVKKTFSLITYYESKLLARFPGGKGHFLFIKKDENDFFSTNPPLTVAENMQQKFGLKKAFQPRDIKIFHLLENLEFKKAKTVLDFGCANGIWLERILAGNHKIGMGVDIAKKLIEVAKNRKIVRGRYFLTDRDWQIPEKSVDFCYSFDTFEHIKNKTLEIKRLAQSLKKGGKILIYTLNPDNKYTIDWLFEKCGSDYMYKRADHDKKIFISPQKMEDLLKLYGFRDINFELYDGPANLVWRVVSYASISLVEKLSGRLGAPGVLIGFINANDLFLKSINPVNNFIDASFLKNGHSNGYFLWAEKA